MKVQIRDKEALESLTIADLRTYLEAHGWGHERPWGTWATILSKEGDDRLWEVSVPNDAEDILYAESVAEIIATLAEAEDRSQLDVFYDIASSEIESVPEGSKRDETMASVWRVGAEKGKYTEHFVAGGYAGIGWLRGSDLTGVTDKEALRCLYKKAYPHDGDATVATNVGQIRRFLVRIKPGDYVITPTEDNAFQRYGRVGSGLYYEQAPNDGCPFPHRRKVDWADQPVKISEFSQPLEVALKFGALTVYEIKQRDEFLTAVGERSAINPFSVVLEEIQKMDAEEFERLVGNFLVKHWDDFPAEFRHRLNLKPGLVPT